MTFPALIDENDGLLGSHLRACGQEHVLRWWPDLDPARRERLCRQVRGIDLELVQRLFRRTHSVENAPPSSEAIRPVDATPIPTSSGQDRREQQAADLGRRALEAGQVAVVLVAGGQGTRLGHPGPKGTFPIGPVSGKSLFQIHAEKVLALGRRYGVRLPLYIMTSPENDGAAREFFSRHAFFALDRDQVVFFRQGTMPALDRHTGRVLVDENYRLIACPNGHGGVVKALGDGGHLADMQRRGIRYVFYYQVDNPLVKVADPAFLGHHVASDAEMSLKVVRKLRPDEKLGVVVEVDGRVQLIEYSDLPEELARRRSADGSLEIWAGNIAVHVFNLSFLQRLAANGSMLPFHRAIKKVPYLDERGRLVRPAENNAVKFEMFVFDALPLARKALVVETDRREEFEPLKNATGENSPQTVRQVMSSVFAGWLRRAGIEVSTREDGSAAFPLEISPLLALDAEELRTRLPRHPPVDEALLLDEKTPTTLQLETCVQ
ncbi:MAG TPA: UDPGP type 1 family protein [Thermoguttaceae bacterium]|nr:UDPGP type 1 family protein [Thermoguttaceae bacterium]